MEAWQAVFRNLYTGFLLRDFAGKIVPGVFLLFSISSLYYQPKRILEFLIKDLPTFTLIFVAGLAWTLTLGTQSLAEATGIWRYFPEGQTFDQNTLQIDEFQSKASEDQKQQYERFVVIKEACGNLFVAGLLSVPAWLLVFLRHRSHASGSQRKFIGEENIKKTSLVLGAIYILILMGGLHLMHQQHVHRQAQYAHDLSEKRKKEPDVNDGTVDVLSTPDGGEMSLDGQYVGNTPSELKLKPGEHTISVKASGYMDWSRVVFVQGLSKVKIIATMDKTQSKAP